MKRSKNHLEKTADRLIQVHIQTEKLNKKSINVAKLKDILKQKDKK